MYSIYPQILRKTHNYKYMHPTGKKLIKSWFNKAWSQRGCQNKNSFEPFIFCWIAFNAWGTCVTSKERDCEIMESLKKADDVNAVFNQMLRDDKCNFHSLANDFKYYWPIFKVQELRKMGIRHNKQDENKREVIVKYYLEKGAIEFQPKFDKNDYLAGKEIPLSFSNTLSAIYRVRCNLFHGEKSMYSEQDQAIVGAAFRVLVYFMHELIYL